MRQEGGLETGRGGFRDVSVRFLTVCTVDLARKAAVRMQQYYRQKPFLQRLMILRAFS